MCWAYVAKAHAREATPSAHLNAHELGERLAGVGMRGNFEVLQRPAHRIGGVSAIMVWEKHRALTYVTA